MAKEALISTSLNQQKLADALDVTRQPISHFFNGKRVKSDLFVRICEKLKLDWKAIALDIDEPTTQASPENAFDSTDDKETASIRYLLNLEIQQDCNLLQKLLYLGNKEYLSEKWQSCLSQNRSVWQNISYRLSLAESSKELMQHIQYFYQQLDEIEEICKKILTFKSKALSIESKPKYQGSTLAFGAEPPAWANKYLTVSEDIELLNLKKIYTMKIQKSKETILKVIDSGNQIIKELNQ
ncbi:helix-turn-helix domain-containing protein [Plectonema radiosum NIES-515]|uniref:Helix-turn-helix domain-containing protein n=1 Tax=Plectonema radiosum NIES-515 TaxID=2986073 RepID=A0ABT3AZA1_9CYAN|nr:helix-turn-helix transcriptional regulator [Plectonema radiosum]MCV3214443.1 helix-turn-helix domain-containing protein [Plectonema radiosum NIES-515]